MEGKNRICLAQTRARTFRAGFLTLEFFIPFTEAQPRRITHRLSPVLLENSHLTCVTFGKSIRGIIGCQASLLSVLPLIPFYPI